MSKLKKPTTPKWEIVLFRCTVALIVVAFGVVLYLNRNDLGGILQ